MVPKLPHLLNLGADCWKMKSFLSDLWTNEWKFSSEPILINSLEHIVINLI